MENNTIDRKRQPQHSDIKINAYPEVETKKMKNGIQLFVMNIQNTDLVRIDFMFRGGAWVQDKPLQAIATLMMLKEGAGKLSPQQINQMIDFYGAKIYVKHSRTYCNLSVLCLKKFIKDVCKIVALFFNSPTFNDNSLQLVKQQLFTNYNIKKEKVGEMAERALFTELLGYNHPATSYETEEDFKNLNKALIEDYYNRFLNSDNCKVVLAGGVDANVMEIINNFFGNTYWGGDKPVLNVGKMICDRDIKPKTNCNNRVEYKMANKSMQAAVAAVNVLPRLKGKELAALLITNDMLGGFFGSRLMANIREKNGLTYGIASTIRNFVNYAAVYIHTETSNDYVDRVIEEIKLEIEAMAKQPPTSEELNRVKNYFCGKSARTYETNLDFPTHLINNIALGFSIEDIAQIHEDIQKLKPQDIAECAKRYLDTNGFIYAVARG